MSDAQIHETAIKVAKEITEMFNDPEFKGYRRPPKTTAKFYVALTKAMEKYPELRVGQLIFNAIALYDQKEHPLGPNYNMNFHMVVFNIYDETLTKALEEFAARK
jgi:hypothetical protein